MLWSIVQWLPAVPAQPEQRGLASSRPATQPKLVLWRFAQASIVPATFVQSKLVLWFPVLWRVVLETFVQSKWVLWGLVQWSSVQWLPAAPAQPEQRGASSRPATFVQPKLVLWRLA